MLSAGSHITHGAHVATSSPPASSPPPMPQHGRVPSFVWAEPAAPRRTDPPSPPTYAQLPRLSPMSDLPELPGAMARAPLRRLLHALPDARCMPVHTRGLERVLQCVVYEQEVRAPLNALARAIALCRRARAMAERQVPRPFAAALEVSEAQACAGDDDGPSGTTAFGLAARTAWRLQHFYGWPALVVGRRRHGGTLAEWPALTADVAAVRQESVRQLHGLTHVDVAVPCRRPGGAVDVLILPCGLGPSEPMRLCTLPQHAERMRRMVVLERPQQWIWRALRCQHVLTVQNIALEQHFSLDLLRGQLVLGGTGTTGPTQRSFDLRELEAPAGLERARAFMRAAAELLQLDADFVEGTLLLAHNRTAYVDEVLLPPGPTLMRCIPERDDALVRNMPLLQLGWSLRYLHEVEPHKRAQQALHLAAALVNERRHLAAAVAYRRAAELFEQGMAQAIACVRDRLPAEACMLTELSARTWAAMPRPMLEAVWQQLEGAHGPAYAAETLGPAAQARMAFAAGPPQAPAASGRP